MSVRRAARPSPALFSLTAFNRFREYCRTFRVKSENPSQNKSATAVREMSLVQVRVCECEGISPDVGRLRCETANVKESRGARENVKDRVFQDTAVIDSWLQTGGGKNRAWRRRKSVTWEIDQVGESLNLYLAPSGG